MTMQNSIPKRHKHADLIHAWAEGAIIQFKLHGTSWTDCPNNDPSWGSDVRYRIKPAVKMIKFRNWLTKSGDIVTWVLDGTPIEVIENYYNFARWIGDWQSVEVYSDDQTKPESFTLFGGIRI